MPTLSRSFKRQLFTLLLCGLLSLPAALPHAAAQDTLTGAFEGNVSDSKTKTPIAGATVRFINQTMNIPTATRTDGQGRFFKGLLQPGVYTLQVVAQGYKTLEAEHRLMATRSNTIVPVPILLEPEVVAVAVTPNAEPRPIAKEVIPTPPPVIRERVEVSDQLPSTEARRGGSFTEKEVESLPLGAASFTRSFDELALLLPGVALPPQTQGGVAGPGVGPGVGSAGQFAINGLRSRGNNFTVDGSDNNDEDIGVRRQGFFTLVPQPIETIKEYQVITALAPAQFGRNLGAQVNAISKSGGSQTHGTFYGFLNTSQLNARDFFDTTSNGRPTRLQGIVRGTGALRDVFVGGRARDVVNPAAGQDSRTFGQAGFVLGGPLLPAAPAGATNAKSAFYLLSFEGQLLNANQEKSFAVPTVEERGLNGSGAIGLDRTSTTGPFGYPTNLTGAAVFSLFPFPNNPAGVYGSHTFTQILPASAQGNAASFKFDHNFKFKGREQSATARYNRTDDWRNIPAAGGALFATLRPVVRTNNFSFFLNSEVSGPNAVTPIFNQFRASYGRTKLSFEEERDVDHLIPSRRLPNEPFLLNAPYLFNFTLPNSTNNFVNYNRAVGFTDTEVDGGLGLVGQLIIAGYSPLGVDVFNFPQRRVNNTYQLADSLSIRINSHSLTLGGDFRRTDLNSDLPRNARPLITFGSTPTSDFDANGAVPLDANGNVIFRRFIAPINRAAVAAPNNVSQTLALKTSNIGLRYYQNNLFVQDEWRMRPGLSLSYGLRYEYNTPPREVDGLIEDTFKDSRLSLLPGLQERFIKNRERIFDPDRNNFAPRVGLAYARNIFGVNSTVFRFGYGLFYDQSLGAVVSQSRNVFPSFLTLNTGGGLGSITNQDGGIGSFDLFNPTRGGLNFGGRFEPFTLPGTLNQYNQTGIPFNTLIGSLNSSFPGEFGLTLPERGLRSPLAHHYSFTVEQQLAPNWVLSAAYVGTQGDNLLRLTTPNLGPNLALAGAYFTIRAFTGTPEIGQPLSNGYRLTPGQTLRLARTVNDIDLLIPAGSRPTRGLGTIFLYQTNATSRYDSLQLELRGRYRSALQMQLSYTFAKALDDVSDVFDLAGAAALPQNSANLANERGPANFDVRQRLAASFTYLLHTLTTRSRAARLLGGGFELAGTYQYQTAQPFTINSLYDINFDGNYTDRLNSTDALLIARGNNRNPVQLKVGDASANANITLPFLAPFGRDGQVGRNTFRAGDFFLANLALIKNFALTERQRVIFRVEAFNVANRANFGVPVRFLESFAFGQATETVTPGRRIQFALKYSF